MLHNFDFKFLKTLQLYITTINSTLATIYIKLFCLLRDINTINLLTIIIITKLNVMHNYIETCTTDIMARVIIMAIMHYRNK